jgi:hypothetical protein
MAKTHPSEAPGVRIQTQTDLDEIGAINKVQVTEADVSSMAGATKTEWIDERGVRQWEVSVPLHNEAGERTRGFGDVMDAQRPVIAKQVDRINGRDSRTPKVEVVNQYGERRRIDARREDQLVNKHTDHYCWKVRGSTLKSGAEGSLWRVGPDGFWEPTGKYTASGAPRWNGKSGRVTGAGIYHDPDGQPWMFDGREWSFLGATEA